MPKKKSAIDDQKFDEFLQKQFAELRRELAKYPAPGAAKEGKILQLPQAARARTGKGSWKYGIAAAVLVAVAVPMVIQMNQQKAELVSKTEAPAAESASRTSSAPEKKQPEKPELDRMSDREESGEKTQRFYKKKSGKSAPANDGIAEERSAPILKASREEATPKDAIAAGKAERVTNEQEGRAAEKNRDNDSDKFAAKKEEAKPVLSQDSRAARADAQSAGSPAAPPAAAPAPRQQASRKASATEISGGDRGAAMDESPAPAEMSSRSVAVDDAKSKLKKQDVSSEEKAEMEKLWKEFEKDPKSFNQDKKRSARLRTLLSRHNEKSRARRMRSAEVAK